MRVTTCPCRGSRKTHVGDRKVAMREIVLEGGEPPVRVYDTSGPYSDPDVHIDIMAGLPQLRRDWIITRGDVEEYDARAVKPEDNGLKGPDRSAGVAPFPKIVQRPLRAKSGMNVRSEEHTSELQSLMRNSYAVFCLQKKKTQNHKQHSP